LIYLNVVILWEYNNPASSLKLMVEVLVGRAYWGDGLREESAQFSP